MRLVYKDRGNEVQLGDNVETIDGDKVQVVYFRAPHKWDVSNSGKVFVKWLHENRQREFHVGVIGAEWVDDEIFEIISKQ